MTRARTLRQIQQAAAQYSQQVSGNQHLLESVKSSSPYDLIKMLLGALESHLNSGIDAITREDDVTMQRSLEKAQATVNYLRACLSYDYYPELAQNLSDLYEYMGHRLVQARMEKDADAVHEVLKLLQPIIEAWKEIEAEASEILTTHGNRDESISERG